MTRYSQSSTTVRMSRKAMVKTTRLVQCSWQLRTSSGRRPAIVYEDGIQ
jgi:hypothetical protein